MPGRFDQEIVPIDGHDEHGTPTMIAHDEVIRADATLEALASLPPAFMPKVGTVTAGFFVGDCRRRLGHAGDVGPEGRWTTV